jgi:hypothetical protein
MRLKYLKLITCDVFLYAKFIITPHMCIRVRLCLKCDGKCAETRFRLFWAKRTSPFKSAGASVQSTTGSRGVRISGSNAGYTMFRGSVKSTGYPLHSPVSLSLPLPWVTVCHHISTGVYSSYLFELWYRLRMLSEQSCKENMWVFVEVTALCKKMHNEFMS